jgi:hypothetical protein
MPLSPLEYLRHILDETKYLISNSQGLSKDRFMLNETLIPSCVQAGNIRDVILNGAKQSEESRFFASLRMTILLF